MSDGVEKSRRVLPAVIVLVATLIGFASVFAIWIKRQALETETWTDTSSELLESAEIRDALANFLVTQLYENVDVEAALAERLPPQAAPLAGPVSGALRQVADEAADRALERPEVQALWEDANRAAHERLLAVIDDEAEALATEDGAVNLDLTVILQRITTELGVGEGLADKIPDGAAQLKVMDEDDLDSIRTVVDLLRTLAWLLLAITLGLYGLAIYLSGERRRETFRLVGFSFIVMGALTLLVQRVAGDAIVGALTENSAAEPAATETWEIATSLLTDSGGAVVVYGIVILFAAWLAGPSPTATSIRGSLTPYMRAPKVAYGGLALLLLLLFWWNPLPSTDRLPTAILLIVLLAAGVEVLRRQLIREFPDRFTTSSPGGVAVRISEQMKAARERRVEDSAPAARAPAEETRVDALERLARLRDDGVLSGEEFEAEKRRILEG